MYPDAGTVVAGIVKLRMYSVSVVSIVNEELPSVFTVVPTAFVTLTEITRVTRVTDIRSDDAQKSTLRIPEGRDNPFPNCGDQR